MIIVSSVDSSNSLIKVNDPKEDPEVGDIVTIEPDNDVFAQDSSPAIDSPGSYVKKVETSDFIIYIDMITRSGDEVTFHGRAKSKIKDNKLTLFLPYGYSYFDHRGEKHISYDMNVKIGNSNDHDNNPKISELVLLGYPTNISWNFDRVPTEADHLARASLYLQTPAAGDVEILLENISLINTF